MPVHKFSFVYNYTCYQLNLVAVLQYVFFLMVYFHHMTLTTVITLHATVCKQHIKEPGAYFEKRFGNSFHFFICFLIKLHSRWLVASAYQSITKTHINAKTRYNR